MSDDLERARNAERMVAELLGGAELGRSTQAAYDRGYFTGRATGAKKGKELAAAEYARGYAAGVAAGAAKGVEIAKGPAVPAAADAATGPRTSGSLSGCGVFAGCVEADDRAVPVEKAPNSSRNG